MVNFSSSKENSGIFKLKIDYEDIVLDMWFGGWISDKFLDKEGMRLAIN